MRSLLLCVAAVLAGCGPAPTPGRTVWVTADLHGRSISANGPTTKEYQWPYRTIMSQTGGRAGEWPMGLAFDRDQAEPRDVEIRCFDAANHSVRVEVTFNGMPNEHLGSITFLQMSNVDGVFELLKGSSRPYEGWSKDGSKLVLYAPPAPTTLVFVGGHSH